MRALDQARAKGIKGRSDVLTVIDYSLPSSQPRLWVLDLALGTVLHHELVTHGVADDRSPTEPTFSNEPGSRASSLGLYRTAEIYDSPKHGYALRLDGLERGFNHRARARAIVMHGADYATQSYVLEHGYLGRSHGCPALPWSTTHAIIDSIAGGTFLFAYYPDPHWLATSSFLRPVRTATR